MTDLYAWAMSRCARRECCRTELRSKLLEKGATTHEADDILQRLTDEGYLDEARYAKAFTSDKFRFDHWGRLKIRYTLLQRGVDETLITAALGRIDDDEYYTALLDFIKSRLLSVSDDDPYRTLQKIMRSAAARGYEPDLVHRALHECLNTDSLEE